MWEVADALAVPSPFVRTKNGFCIPYNTECTTEEKARFYRNKINRLLDIQETVFRFGEDPKANATFQGCGAQIKKFEKRIKKFRTEKEQQLEALSDILKQERKMGCKERIWAVKQLGWCRIVIQNL